VRPYSTLKHYDYASGDPRSGPRRPPIDHKMLASHWKPLTQGNGFELRDLAAIHIPSSTPPEEKEDE
jgi:hypothetical protein